MAKSSKRKMRLASSGVSNCSGRPLAARNSARSCAAGATTSDRSPRVRFEMLCEDLLVPGGGRVGTFYVRFSLLTPPPQVSGGPLSKQRSGKFGVTVGPQVSQSVVVGMLMLVVPIRRVAFGNSFGDNVTSNLMRNRQFLTSRQLSEASI